MEVFMNRMNVKSLFCIGAIFSSCYAGYNPEGFTCTISNFNIPNFPMNVIIKMTNPPLYIYQWDGIKGEFTDTKVYLKSFEFNLERNSDNTDHIKYAITSDHVSSSVDVNNVRLRCLGYDNKLPVVNPDDEPYTFSISISDLFSSSIYMDFSVGYGRVCFGWYQPLQLIVEIVNSLSEANCGPKIFIDEYLNQ
jgi:hypothetical protein